MVLALAKDQSARLLKHVVRCYLRLSDNARYACYCFFALFMNYNNTPKISQQYICIYNNCIYILYTPDEIINYLQFHQVYQLTSRFKFF